MVPAGGSGGRGARPSDDRARARLRDARGRLAVSRDGCAPRAERPRVDAHDDAPVVGHLGDRRSGAGGAGPRARARRHSRRPQAEQPDARSRLHLARPARLHPRSRARLAPAAAARLAPRRLTRARARAALGGGDGRVGRAGADPEARSARGAGDGSLRARVHRLPHPDRQGGMGGERAGRPPRPQAKPGPAAAPPGGGADGGRAVRRAAPGEEAVASLGVRGGRAARVDGLPSDARADARRDRRRAGHVAAGRRRRSPPRRWRRHARSQPGSCRCALRR